MRLAFRVIVFLVLIGRSLYAQNGTEETAVTRAKVQVFQTVFAAGSLSNPEVGSIPTVISYFVDKSSPARPEIRAFSTASETGSVWGLAYDARTHRVFTSALLKRHSALGPLGPGGIYVTSVEEAAMEPFLSLDSLGFPTAPSLGERALSPAYGKPDHDSLAFGLVGKVGLGGLAVSDDGRFLYTMNLYDRNLYRIDISVSDKKPDRSSVTRYPLPASKEAGGELRPFAVKYHKGRLYVGAVFDAQESRKIEQQRAFVYVFNDSLPGRFSFNEIASFSLDYTRGHLDYGVSGWFPWTERYERAIVNGQPSWMIYPQPMLADIDFDVDGSMVVSMMDRLGHQTADGQLFRLAPNQPLLNYRGLSGGDLLRLSEHNGRYTLEHNAQAAGRLAKAGRSNNQGPGGGEFYSGDGFSLDRGDWNQETTVGGIAMLPEEGGLLVSVREPGSRLSGGIKLLNNRTGVADYEFAVTPEGGVPGYFWRQNNVGDLLVINSRLFSEKEKDNQESESEGSIMVYPNPLIDDATFLYQGRSFDGPVSLEVLDATGRVIESRSTHLKQSYYRGKISLSGKAGGQYFLRVTEQGKSFVKTLIKQ